MGADTVDVSRAFSNGCCRFMQRETKCGVQSIRVLMHVGKRNGGVLNASQCGFIFEIVLQTVMGVDVLSDKKDLSL